MEDGEHEITPRELVERIKTLPPTEKTAIYRAALKAYEDAIVRIHFRESEQDPEEKIASPIKT